MSSKTQTDSTADKSTDSYGADSDLVDFILGITFEIWEQGQVEKIHHYYAADCEVYSLEGMTENAATMVSNTHATLASFPDRLLIADDVITTGTAKKSFSSQPDSTGPFPHKLCQLWQLKQPDRVNKNRRIKMLNNFLMIWFP